MRPGPRTVFIDDRATYQTVQGFGAAWTDSAAYLLHEVAGPRTRERAMHALFTREDGGIGLSFMRIPMGASDIARSRYEQGVADFLHVLDAQGNKLAESSAQLRVK